MDKKLFPYPISSCAYRPTEGSTDPRSDGGTKALLKMRARNQKEKKSPFGHYIEFTRFLTKYVAVDADSRSVVPETLLLGTFQTRSELNIDGLEAAGRERNASRPRMMQLTHQITTMVQVRWLKKKGKEK